MSDGEGGERTIWNGKETKTVNPEFAPRDVVYETKTTLILPKERGVALNSAETAFAKAVDNYFEAAKNGQPKPAQDRLDGLKAEFMNTVRGEFGQAIMNAYSAGQTASEPPDVMYNLGESLKSIPGLGSTSRSDLREAYDGFKKAYQENVVPYLPSIDRQLARESAENRRRDGYAINTYTRLVPSVPTVTNDLGSKVSQQELSSKGWTPVQQPAAQKQGVPLAEAH